ncbi:MAG: ribonucleoside-triphosphate reductase, adenosylcobalamin-dependent [Chitinophagaceae bacterium]
MTQLLPDISKILSLASTEPTWGPNGKDVYERTYQRIKADGTKETWDDTVRRVVKGNLSLVPAERIEAGEEEELYNLFYNFGAIPGGRHLWMSGVEGRQFLFNCYVSGWGDSLSDHFAFTFNQLMEGGGVGANYSSKYLKDYNVYNMVRVHIVCSPEHENYKDLEEAGLLSSVYVAEYGGAIEVDDSREGWVEALTRTIDLSTEYQPAGYKYDKDTGEYLPELIFDVSNIRAAGKRIKTFGGTSAGPVPFARMMTQVAMLLSDAWLNGVSGPFAMDMDHTIATCVVSGNVRRSARMSIMHWDDPWINWFLTCKQTTLSHWSTNISVEIDDEFVSYIQDSSSPESESDIAKRNRARQVYEAIVYGMLENGEPGIWNSSLSNVGEPNLVIATNPCGEIALEEWENCNLGHINLGAFVSNDGIVDYDGLARAHELMARFLLRATFGDISDPKTRDVVLRNRRIGVGHFGFADYLAKQKILFSKSWQYGGVAEMLYTNKYIVDRALAKYAHELRIPVPVKSTTMAPTGTIAKLAGASEGIAPYFARYYIQRIRFSTVDPSQAAKLQSYKDQGYNVVVDPSTPYTEVVEIPTKTSMVSTLEEMGIAPHYAQSADEVKFEDFLQIQAMYQKYWADNAISSTINIKPNLHNVPEIMETIKPFLGVLKGTTVFPERGYELPPLERVTLAEYEALRGSQSVLEGDAIDPDCATGACPVR